MQYGGSWHLLGVYLIDLPKDHFLEQYIVNHDMTPNSPNSKLGRARVRERLAIGRIDQVFFRVPIPIRQHTGGAESPLGSSSTVGPWAR